MNRLVNGLEVLPGLIDERRQRAEEEKQTVSCALKAE